MEAASFHGFAGAFAVASRNVGLDLQAVMEPGGFGAASIERNREMLRFAGPVHTIEGPPAYDVPILMGNPPCSGFSCLNTSKGTGARGVGARQNACMWAFVRYAATMNGGRGPEVAIFESVQQAFNQGRGLMRELWRELRTLTGEDFQLTNLLMSGASVGAAQIRRRYFWVAHRVPFGIEPPRIDRVVTHWDAISDLEFQPLAWDPQPYNQPALTPLQERLRSSSGEVADHENCGRMTERRFAQLADHMIEGDSTKSAMRTFIEANGGPPDLWTEAHAERHMNKSFGTGRRIRRNAPGYVITGTGGSHFVHWSQPRTLTIRETARMMGFPDDFRWDFASCGRMRAMLGKQVPVQSWEWALRWVRSAVEGNPGPWQGEVIASEPGVERLIDVTNDFKAIYDERKRVHGVDSRNKRLVDAMAHRSS